MAQNEFHSRVLEHDAVRVLRESQLLVAKVTEAPTGGVSIESRHCLERLGAVVGETLLRIDANPQLVTPRALDAMYGYADSIHSALVAYDQDREYPICDVARDDADQILDQMAAIPNYATATKKLSSSLNYVRKDFEDSQAGLRVSIDQAQKTLGNLRRQTEEFLDSRVASFDEKQAEIAKKANDAAAMMNAIAGYSLGNQYEQEREEQDRSERLWTRLGYAAIGLLVAIATAIFVLPFAGVIDTPDSLGSGIGRFFQQSPLLGGLATAATLFLRKASYHRKRAEQATRIKNELVMLWAFIERLPEDAQNYILTLVAPRYFTGANSLANETRDDRSIVDLFTRQKGHENEEENPS